MALGDVGGEDADTSSSTRPMCTCVSRAGATVGAGGTTRSLARAMFSRGAAGLTDCTVAAVTVDDESIPVTVAVSEGEAVAVAEAVAEDCAGALRVGAARAVVLGCGVSIAALRAGAAGAAGRCDSTCRCIARLVAGSGVVGAMRVSMSWCSIRDADDAAGSAGAVAGALAARFAAGADAKCVGSAVAVRIGATSADCG